VPIGRSRKRRTEGSLRRHEDVAQRRSVGHPDPHGGRHLAVPALRRHHSLPDLRLALGLPRAGSGAVRHRRLLAASTVASTHRSCCVYKKAEAKHGMISGALLLRTVAGRLRGFLLSDGRRPADGEMRSCAGSEILAKAE
jgi:hypothetical protein